MTAAELDICLALLRTSLNARIDQALDRSEYGPGGHLYSFATTLLAAVGGKRDVDDDLLRVTKHGRWAPKP